MSASLIAQGVSAEFALSLTEREQLAFYIALGEQRGGEWNYRTMEWWTQPSPAAVLAVPAEMKDDNST